MARRTRNQNRNRYNRKAHATQTDAMPMTIPASALGLTGSSGPALTVGIISEALPSWVGKFKLTSITVDASTIISESGTKINSGGRVDVRMGPVSYTVTDELRLTKLTMPKQASESFWLSKSTSGSTASVELVKFDSNNEMRWVIKSVSVLVASTNANV